MSAPFNFSKAFSRSIMPHMTRWWVHSRTWRHVLCNTIPTLQFEVHQSTDYLIWFYLGNLRTISQQDVYRLHGLPHTGPSRWHARQDSMQKTPLPYSPSIWVNYSNYFPKDTVQVMLTLHIQACQASSLPILLHSPMGSTWYASIYTSNSSFKDHST